jgi:hypothetical protein
VHKFPNRERDPELPNSIEIVVGNSFAPCSYSALSVLHDRQHGMAWCRFPRQRHQCRQQRAYRLNRDGQVIAYQLRASAAES